MEGLGCGPPFMVSWAVATRLHGGRAVGASHTGLERWLHLQVRGADQRP